MANLLSLRQDGAILADGREVAPTLQCCHCGGHFTPRPGSGTIRGFCLRCMAPTCGNPACNACIPIETKLEAVEKGEVWQPGM